MVKIPSAQTVFRAAMMTGMSLIVLRLVGEVVPQLKGIPVINAVFR